MNSQTALLPLPIIQPESMPSVEDEGGLNVGGLLRALQRRWFLIVGITLVTTTAAAAKVLTGTQVYSSTLEILVQPITAETEVISTVPGTLTSGEQSVAATTLSSDLLKILTSPSVLAPVVEELQARYPQFCQSSGGDGQQAKIADERCYGTIRSGLQVGGDGNKSDILQIRFEDPDPQKVTTILEAVSAAYLKYSLSAKQVDIKKGIEFVDQKLPDLQKKVDLLQGQLQTLRLSNNLIDPDSRGSQLSSQVGTFTQQQREIEVELKGNRETYQELSRQLQQPAETAASSALADNPRYQALLNSLLELDAEIAEASTLYLNSSPDMQLLQEERQNLVQLLNQQALQSEQEILNKIRELESRDQAVQEAIQGINADIGDLSGISRDYTDIQRELQITTENLTQFLSKKEALEIDAAQSEIPWEVVTPPTNPRSNPVNLPQNLALGAILGLLLGTGAALLIDRSAEVIYSDEEIRRITRLPVLARIPNQEFVETIAKSDSMVEAVQYVGSAIRSGASKNSNGASFSNHAERFTNGTSKRTLPSHPYANDPFSESFRSLYTNLRLLNPQRPVRSVTISSVMPGEGKSTVAVYLAEAAAAMGQKVLLIDADLRNPHIHTYLELSNDKGLTNLFSGESNPAVIQKFAPTSSLYAITTGSIPFEPTRLFSSRGMKRFTEKIGSTFDLIIYDAPPLLGQSDAYLIADHTDGMLLVTKPGQLKQSLLDRAMEQLDLAGVNMLGLVSRER